MYDTFSSDYDRFVSWPGRLALELPFIEQELQKLGPCEQGTLRVLDAACGTGMHTIALAKRGYAMTGADLSVGMVERARAHAAAGGMEVRFEGVGFGALAKTFQDQPPFDAVLCLGNSLPHLLTQDALISALADFAACLKPGGLLLLQNRNFDAVMASQERWMEPQSHREEQDEAEWIFLRFYDYQSDGLINFNIVTLKRHGGGDWKQSVNSTLLRPLLEVDLHAALTVNGFDHLVLYGNMTGTAFDPHKSGNLVVTAWKSG
jgi:glycine/sarcosine N-methyltransferase